MSAPELDPETLAALDVARDLARAGVPIFAARPALDEAGRWLPDGGHNGCGYWLPDRWQHAPADPATVDQWRPGLALAAVMGHVVDGADVDPRNGGQATAEAMASAGVWPRSIGRQTTPSGGWHDLVNPLGVASRDGVAPGVDVKAGLPDGTGRGFLWIAPTVKLSKATGEIGVYRWTVPPMLDELDPGDDTGSALAERIRALRADTGDDEPDTPHAAHEAMTDAQRAAVARYLAAVVAGTRAEMQEAATWPEGRTDDHGRGWQKLTADACNRFGRLARADWTGWTMAEARAQLAAVVPDRMAREVGLGATWKAQKDRRGPATYPATLAADEWLYGLPTYAAEQPSAIPDAPPAVDTETGEDDDPAARARRVFPRLDWHALWADDSEDEWLHVPLLPARRSVVIYSPPKVGKSLLMLEFAVHLSRGGNFLGHQIERRIRVLYVDFENDPRGDVRARLQAMGFGPDDLDHLDYLSFPTMAGLDTERGSLELLEAVKAYGSEVVIVDTVSRAVDGEENSNDTWLGLYRHTGLKLKQAGVAIVRLDHTGKDESKGQRGGSAKSGDVDAVWRLTRITDERFRLDCTDSRMQVETKSLHVIRQRVPRLRHVAEVLGAMTDRESKVAHLIELCNTNGIPADANRETVRAFAKARGITARNDVLADVIRARKAVPDGGDSNEPGQARNGAEASGTLGDRSSTTTLPEHESPLEPVPDPLGTTGDSGTGPTVPGAAVRSTAPAGQRDETPACPVCGGGMKPTQDLCGPCGHAARMAQRIAEAEAAS